MPRASPSSSPAQLSHAIDLFIHKDRSSFFDDDSIAVGAVAAFEPPPALAESQSFDWDLPAICTPDFPAYQYISNKLHQRELSVALIIASQEPYVIPVWPLPRKSQVILAQIVRKAVKKFQLQPSWLTALASSSNNDVPSIFEAHRPGSYVVRRSIVQHEIVFSEEGLTLLTIDHIFTFKQLLRTLSRKDWIPHDREVRLSSCVHLLHRINETYTDPQVSRGYLKRVYREIEYQKASWQEVNSAYDVNYCTASIKDVTMLEPDFTALSDMASDIEGEDECETQTPTPTQLPPSTGPNSIAELPDTSPTHTNPNLISPLETIDLNIINTWSPQASRESLDYISPLTVRHFALKYRPQSIILESPIDSDAPWSYAIPPPLRTKRISTTPPSISPPSSSSYSNETEDTWLASIPPACEMVERWSHTDLPPAPSVSVSAHISSSGESGKAPMDLVRAWVESWSAPGVLCENCHEVAVQPLLPRRFTMA